MMGRAAQPSRRRRSEVLVGSKWEELLKRTPAPPRNLRDLSRIFERQGLAVSPTPGPRHDLVVIVHGTFANPDYRSSSSASHAHWWETHGSLARALDAALARHGSEARCSLPIGSRLRSLDNDRRRLSSFAWSGANSEVERRAGKSVHLGVDHVVPALPARAQAVHDLARAEAPVALLPLDG
jgi:hypothetical protein